MSLSGHFEDLARRVVRRGFKQNSTALIGIGGMSILAARIVRRTPQVVYQEELPVGTTLTISYHDPND